VHPALNRDHASFWNPIAVQWLRHALKTGIERRTAMCRDLMSREAWDLFLTAFGETHTAGHYFWHTGDGEHPLHSAADSGTSAPDRTPILSTFQQVDNAIGAIAREVPADSHLVVFSVHGMEANCMDLPSMVFLPELMYRLSFPGKTGLANGRMGSPLPGAVTMPRSLSWQRDIWSRKQDGPAFFNAMRRVLPIELSHGIEKLFGMTNGLDYPSAAGELWYQPAMWYRSFWPSMRAFALPSFSEGYVRINVRGRERGGIVSPDDYDAVCEEIRREILGLRHARTGEPVATDVIRARLDPFEGGNTAPDADIVVVWNSNPVDVVESATVGRIGPVPYGRTGSHVSRGFVVVRGPGIDAGTQLEAGDVKDVAPTLLSLAGVPLPGHLQGKSLLQPPRI
jgi:predicted AlkP superfamily phosphohydrolase/phosphomutase